MSEDKLWLFDGSNFGNWKFRIEVLMEDRNMLECLTKAIDEEEYSRDLATDSAEERAEKKKKLEARWALDRKCKNLLIHRIAEDQLEYVKDKKTAKDVWDALRNAFERVGIAGKLILRKQFQELKLREGGDVKQFLLQFEKILRELRAVDVNMQEEDVVCQLLLALPKSYDALITALETIQPQQLTLEYVKKRLLDEQVKRANSSHAGDSGHVSDSAFAGKKTGLKCFGCGKFGHKRAECPENSPSNESGHHGYRKSGGKTNRKQKYRANVADESEIAFVAAAAGDCLSVTTATESLKINWVLDSGATDHMVRSKVYFEELHPLPKKVRIAVAKSGQALLAEYAGTVRVNMLIGERKLPAVVENVLYVPGLECNLFSVRRVEDNGMTVKISNGAVTILKSERVVAIGQRTGQLYMMNIELRGHGGASSEPGAMAAKQDCFELWHRRFGHLGEASMKTLWKHGMVDTSSKILDWPDQCICEVCIQARQTRVPFDDVRERCATRPLEVIHSDVCGPFTPRTWDNKRYFLTFIDGYSHFTVVYLLHSKDEVQEKFEEYYARVTAFFGARIARLRCDNGGEYLGGTFRKFCRSKGISIETTVPYSPQQNGVAERMNRTLLEKSRSMIQDAGLPKSMWGEAVLTAAYVTNRSPTSALKEKKTPFEVWYGKKPNIDKMRVFGSVAYTWVPKEKRSKLDPRSEKNILVGYTTNGYRIWDGNKNKIFVSRDVVFDEKRCGSEQQKPIKRVLHRSYVESETSEDCSVLEPDTEPRNANQPKEEPEDHLATDEDGGEATGDDGEVNDDGGEGDDTGALPSQPERDNCPAEVLTRRSERERRLPGKFLDFITGSRATTAAECFSGASDGYADSMMAYALSAETFVDNLPTTIDGLRRRNDWHDWKKAIASELESLHKNETWELVPRPPGKNIIDCRWVFRIKRDEAGNVDRYKARLVAKGYSQRKGFDYDETYAPVAKGTTVRVLLAVANQMRYHIHQMDVKTAFLNGRLTEEIFMRQPEGLEPADPDLVCRLKKSLYGLKQAPRSWNSEFHNFILQLGFRRSNMDSCLYWWREENEVVFLLLYVDDIILVSSRLDLIAEIKKKLSSRFEMTDVGEMKTFLGLKVDRDRRKGLLKISQPNYIGDLLRRFGMSECKPTTTPLEPNLKLKKREDEPLTAEPYRELIGCLTYLALSSRPDICAAVNFFSKFQSAPTDTHWSNLKRILRYLKGTMSHGLVFQRREASEPLKGYADADWGNDPDDRKSISGNVFQFFDGTVSWMTRKQGTVALSSTEAEYVSLSNAVCEAIWLRNLIMELGIELQRPVPLFEDNQSCICLAEEARDHKRMKHVDIRYNFIRDTLQEGQFKVYYIPTSEQLADLFTKGLARGPFEKLRNKLGLFG